jgi:hypothetical protein
MTSSHDNLHPYSGDANLVVGPLFTTYDMTQVGFDYRKVCVG